MPIVLSLAYSNDTLYAAGPEGLFQLENGELVAMPQPQVELACCAAANGRIWVGGLPHGVAFTLSNGSWQAGWMDGVGDSIYCIAPDPRVEQTGVILAGAAGGGILRSHNRGQTWSVCNYGLQEFNVLSLAWAPQSPAGKWPRWEFVFAGTEHGAYRSPNAGRGWKQSEGIEGVVQSIAVAPDFHESGVVLAATESNGLWRSTDAGRSFIKVAQVADQINAIVATADEWFLSDAQGVWRSKSGTEWQIVPGVPPALTMINTAQAVWAGGEEGVFQVFTRKTA